MSHQINLHNIKQTILPGVFGFWQVSFRLIIVVLNSLRRFGIVFDKHHRIGFSSTYCISSSSVFFSFSWVRSKPGLGILGHLCSRFLFLRRNFATSRRSPGSLRRGLWWIAGLLSGLRNGGSIRAWCWKLSFPWVDYRSPIVWID